MKQDTGWLSDKGRKRYSVKIVTILLYGPQIQNVYTQETSWAEHGGVHL
jgi:hypothetical protein